MIRLTRKTWVAVVIDHARKVLEPGAWPSRAAQTDVTIREERSEPRAPLPGRREEIVTASEPGCLGSQTLRQPTRAGEPFRGRAKAIARSSLG